MAKRDSGRERTIDMTGWRRILTAVIAAMLVPALALAASGLSVDRSTSDSLTRHLHKNRLPLVRAQVSNKPDGSRQVLLYGFVATDFGKRDAEKKARNYLNDQDAEVLNHIHIDPSIRHLKKYQPSAQGSAPSAAPPGAPPGMPQAQAPKSADWENDVDTYLNRGGISPSNDPNLNMPPSE